MKPIELDRPPAGWSLLDVMRKEGRKWDWVALMVDVDPDDDAAWEAIHEMMAAALH